MNNQEPTYTILLQEPYCNYIDAQYLHITTNEELETIFKTINSTREPGVEVPSVDFSKNSLLFLAMGQKNTGGYSISIAKIVKEENNWVVIVKKSAPGPTDFVTDVITTPYILAAIPKTSATILFRDLTQ